ncbi:BAR domain-containing protein [Dipodascopsis tothii]|uniref:BAR domain-containing protein n=1 Tax=Dipodascopsis tothii TaxID=44089 RepID=UPI0034CE6D5D
MSWKGIQKSVARAPQNMRQKLNIGQHTKDAVFIDAERRFKELEQETKKLHDESRKYFESINSMLTHQIEFSKAIEEIYKPISGRLSDPDSSKPEGNPEGIAACEQYRDIVSDLQTTLQPELEMLDTRIIRPADDLLDIMKIIQKLLVKRGHKQLDLDRYNMSVKKLQDKRDRTMKEEKQLYTAENNLEVATQEYNYYNDMLKAELPQLFTLETEFIKPLFQSFYYMQLNIFYTLYERMEGTKIPYFDLTSDIETAFNAKRGNVQERAEEIPLTRFNASRRVKRFNEPKGRVPSKTYTPGGAAAPPPYSGSPVSSTYGGYQGQEYGSPSYSPAPSTYAPSPTGYAPTAGSPVYGQQPAAVGYAAPAAPAQQYAYQPAAPAAPVAETVIAQFDYAAQAEGDLSFRAGDRIEIIQRTADPNGWWTGALNGVTGVFPGNYVSLES